MNIANETKEFDVLVIGSGPGGYTAAKRAAEAGLRVAVAERERIGGVCTNVGCIPSKVLISEAHRFEIGGRSNLDFAEVQAFKDAVVQKQSGGVGFLLKNKYTETFRGEARLISDHEAIIDQGGTSTRIRFEHCILATGSRPIELPAFPFGGRILSSTEALGLQQVPESLIVIGGGYIGIELGQTFAKFGSKVTILEGGDQILPGFEAELTRPVAKKLQENQVDIFTGAIAERVEQQPDRVTVHFKENGNPRQATAQYVLVTVGRRPNTDGNLGLDRAGVKLAERGLIPVDEQGRTNVPHIFAIGDIVAGPALAHKAYYEAKVAVEALTHHHAKVDYRALPLVVFSDPEVASVGWSETDARARGTEVVTGRASYAINGRALALRAAEGFVKIVAEKETERIIGAQIVGAEASNLIAELALAIEMSATLEDIALTIHAHPTLGEIVMEAAEAAIAKRRK
ncbi:dihydrolipoyl dehydrogenase [Paenibacillus cookii]|uniref:Dihydrolipoyl dehydrogenase n=1 Tax=Paenibacillus cookii TaxID=157839 RepID=A0ABQ4M3L2_9BACL|nr:dihydrolipoyl dehydrogenase [Paenibacillus cookii]KHF32969.1 Dihydrolipoyl dehydrogenase [Paenibacillus sp. P1XP2]GIO70049.1 dihydrolipoyl dehydrogenase [Paenibacillus cookii]